MPLGGAVPRSAPTFGRVQENMFTGDNPKFAKASSVRFNSEVIGSFGGFGWRASAFAHCCLTVRAVGCLVILCIFRLRYVLPGRVALRLHPGACARVQRRAAALWGQSESNERPAK